MSNHLWQRLRRLVLTKEHITTENPTPNQSASIATVNGRKRRHLSLSAKISTMRSAKTETQPSKSHKTIHLIKKPSSETENTHSCPPKTASAISHEEKVNISNENLPETEEVKVISSERKTELDRCPICLDDYMKPRQLDKCGHIFCTDCIDQYFQIVKPQCPCCFTVYGEIRGNQPDDGTMTYNKLKLRLPGFEHSSCSTIQITYTFPNGIQSEKHPNPGMPYYGTIRRAYLPDNPEGQHVLELLKKAFALRQIFTVGQSRTTGCDNVVTWNDIHHKTHVNGGIENFGYPDKTYLERVQQELAAKEIK